MAVLLGDVGKHMLQLAYDSLIGLGKRLSTMPGIWTRVELTLAGIDSRSRVNHENMRVVDIVEHVSQIAFVVLVSELADGILINVLFSWSAGQSGNDDIHYLGVEFCEVWVFFLSSLLESGTFPEMAHPRALPRYDDDSGTAIEAVHGQGLRRFAAGDEIVRGSGCVEVD